MAGDVASRFARQVGLSSAIELPPAVRKLLDEGRLNEAAEAMAMEAKKPLRGSVTETVDPSRGARKRGMTDASVDWAGDAVRALIRIPDSNADAARMLRRGTELPRQADIRELLGYGLVGGGAAGLLYNTATNRPESPEEPPPQDSSSLPSRRQIEVSRKIPRSK